MRSLALPTFGLLLLGCTGKGVVQLTPTETGETGDSGEPASTDTSLCGAYSGLDVEGRVWIYDWVFGDQAGSGVTTLTELDEIGQTATVDSSLQAYGEGFSYASTTSTTYICDGDGLWMGTQLSQWETTSDGSTNEDWLLTTYDPPWLMVARDMAPGAAWDGTTSRAVEGGQTPAATAEVRWSHTVGAEEQVTVPAGTYSALRVDVSGDLGVTSWMAVGTGLVQTEDLKLVSVQD